MVGKRKNKEKKRSSYEIRRRKEKVKTKTISNKKKKNYMWKFTDGGWQSCRRGGRRHVALQQPSSGRTTWRRVGRRRFKLSLKDEREANRRLRKFVDGSFRGGGILRWNKVEVRREKTALGFGVVEERKEGKEDGGRRARQCARLTVEARKMAERDRESTRGERKHGEEEEGEGEEAIVVEEELEG